MSENPFVSQNEIFFIMYEDIIKTFKFHILKKLLTTDLREGYDGYIDFSKIENKSDDELMTLTMTATDKNILKYLALKKFDFDATYIDLYLNNKDIIKKSQLLSFGNSIRLLLPQKFVNKIYIYNKYRDDDIYKDIYDIYSSKKITFTYGDFDDVIEAIHKKERITTYVLNDVTLINNLIDSNRIQYRTVLVPSYGYNYTVDNTGKVTLRINEIDKLSKDKIFKFETFYPMSMNTK